MNFTQKFFQLAQMPLTHRFGLLLFVLLFAILVNVSHAANTGNNQEQTDHRPDVEPRQFSGFNANAAFNSNFGSSNFGLNHGDKSGNRGGGSGGGGGVNSVYGNSPTTQSPFNIPNFSTTNNPNSNSFNNFNSFNSYNQKETNKNIYNENNERNPSVRYVDRFNNRYPDGSYEYRYELSDGTARYERGYFLLYDNKKTLVVVGYYSYRMADGRYITVFYNADRNGYRQNQSITPKGFPNLPRSIDVPQYKSKETDDADEYYSKTTTANPRLTTTTTRRGGHF